MIKKAFMYVARAAYYLFMCINYNCSHRNVILSLTAKIKHGTKFGGPNKVGAHTYLSGDIGGYTYIGANCQLGRIKIGRFCSISPNVKVITANHPIEYTSTSPVFYSTGCQCGETFVNVDTYNDLNLTENGYSCNVGNDVWIGENVIIKGGITIGNGACIAMGAVVTKDVPPYTVVGGVPAKVIRKRFDNNDVIRALTESKWWDADPSKLQQAAKYIDNPIEFIKKIK